VADNHTAAFPQQVLSGTCVTSVANTTLTDTPDGVVLLFTAPAQGADIRSLTVVPRANASATVGYVYTLRSGDTAKRLRAQKVLYSGNVSATAAVSPTDFGYSVDSPLQLAGGEQLWVATSVALTAGWAWAATGVGYTPEA
jgi:hypothetical protein